MDKNYTRLGGLLGLLVYISIIAFFALRSPYLTDSQMLIISPFNFIIDVFGALIFGFDHSISGLGYISLIISLICYIAAGALLGRLYGHIKARRLGQ